MKGSSSLSVSVRSSAVFVSLAVATILVGTTNANRMPRHLLRRRLLSKSSEEDPFGAPVSHWMTVEGGTPPNKENSLESVQEPVDQSVEQSAKKTVEQPVEGEDGNDVSGFDQPVPYWLTIKEGTKPDKTTQSMAEESIEDRGVVQENSVPQMKQTFHSNDENSAELPEYDPALDPAVVGGFDVIPKRLWFTHGKNILETKSPSHLYDNVMHTIDTYLAAWNEKHGPFPYNQNVNEGLSPPNMPQVNFLDDETCKDYVKRAYPDLLPYFLKETTGAYRGDICRVAALYLYGGYYFDADMVALKPYFPPETMPEIRLEAGETSLDAGDYEADFRGVKFVSVYGCSGACFFQSFMASVPRHPILEGTFLSMLHAYRRKDQVESGEVEIRGSTGPTFLVGPFATYNGYKRFRGGKNKTDAILSVHMLDELKLDVSAHPRYYPDFPRQKGHGGCNQIVHDQYEREVYFFSRMVGVGSCHPGIVTQRMWLVHDDLSLSRDVWKARLPAPIYRNVEHMVKLYREIWRDPNAKTKGLLPDATCQSHVDVAYPDLQQHYKEETNLRNRLDMCRAAVMFHYGGFVTDITMQAVNTFTPRDDGTAVILSRSCTGEDSTSCQYGSFTASATGHILLERILEKMKEIYEPGLAKNEENKEGLVTAQSLGESGMLFSVSVARALASLGDGDLSNVQFLEQTTIATTDAPRSHQYLQKWWGEYGTELQKQESSGEESQPKCNFVVHDPDKETVYYHGKSANACPAETQ